MLVKATLDEVAKAMLDDVVLVGIMLPGILLLVLIVVELIPADVDMMEDVVGDIVEDAIEDGTELVVAEELIIEDIVIEDVVKERDSVDIVFENIVDGVIEDIVEDVEGGMVEDVDKVTPVEIELVDADVLLDKKSEEVDEAKIAELVVMESDGGEIELNIEEAVLDDVGFALETSLRVVVLVEIGNTGEVELVEPYEL